MKKVVNLFYVMFFIFILFLLTGCDNNTGSNEVIENEVALEENQEESAEEIAIKEKLMKVLNNEEKFIPDEYLSENGEEVYLKDLDMYGDIADVEKYTYADLDQDGTVELLCLTKSQAGLYIIFHCESEKIYGYVLSIRSIENVKTDGTFYASGGASTYGYGSLKFNQQKCEGVTLALRDYDEYKINDQSVSKDEFEAFEKQQNEKQDAKWENFIASNNDNNAENNNSDNNNANNNKANNSANNVSSDGLDFKSDNEIKYVSSEEGDPNSEYSETILILKKDGTATEEYTYPGVTAFGTYEYKDNVITITYTKEIDSTVGDAPIEFNMVKSYEMKEGKLYCQETPYYTAIYERK